MKGFAMKKIGQTGWVEKKDLFVVLMMLFVNRLH